MRIGISYCLYVRAYIYIYIWKRILKERDKIFKTVKVEELIHEFLILLPLFLLCLKIFTIKKNNRSYPNIFTILPGRYTSQLSLTSVGRGWWGRLKGCFQTWLGSPGRGQGHWRGAPGLPLMFRKGWVLT